MGDQAEHAVLAVASVPDAPLLLRWVNQHGGRGLRGIPEARCLIRAGEID
jgi:hypothetical protein